jgi:hypothetical protein
LKSFVLLFCCVLSFSCFADSINFSFEEFAFELKLEQREQAILNNDSKQLETLQSTTPTARGSYFLNKTSNNSQQALPEAFYLVYENCQEIDFCSFFKSELAKRLTKHYRIADQISLSKLTDRAVLCDLEILKECYSDGEQVASIELLPQLVVKLSAWQNRDKKYAGYEAHIALLEFGEIVWLDSFYIPYSAPRPSLRKLASNISVKMVDS